VILERVDFFPYGLSVLFPRLPTPRVKPTKAIGGFSFVPRRCRTVRGSNAPNPAADKKRVQDGGNGFPNPVQIRKACGGREPSSRGEMVSNPFHAKVGIFPGEAILLSYPLGVGGRLGEIIEYLYIRQSMCSKNEQIYT
jgi:hypothetical protein